MLYCILFFTEISVYYILHNYNRQRAILKESKQLVCNRLAGCERALKRKHALSFSEPLIIAVIILLLFIIITIIIFTGGSNLQK